jgi:tetratricopeptide (TPR) repeat protein
LEIAPDDADLYKRRAEGHEDIALFIDDDCEGADEFKKAEYMLAVEDYSAAIKLNPCDAESYRKRGSIYYSYLGDDQKALTDYDQAIAIDPDMYLAYFARGELYYDQNKFQAAINEFDKAISLKENEFYYWSRGHAYEKKGDFDNAFADFREAARLDYTGFRFYELAGKYKERGEYQQAIEVYSESIKKRHEGASFEYSLRAEAYELQGNYKAALADYTKVIELANSAPSSWVYCDRAEIYEKIGDKEAAHADYTRAIAILTKAIEVDGDFFYCFRSEIYDKLGNKEAAIADLTTMIQILSEGTVVEHENHKKTIRILSGGKEEEYSDIDIAYAYSMRGELYYDTGKYTNAEKDLSKAIEFYNKVTDFDNKWLAEMHYYRGLVYKGLDDNAKAKQDFETAVRLDPDKDEYRGALESNKCFSPLHHGKRR